MELIMLILICLGPIVMVLFKILKIPYNKGCLGCGIVGFCGDHPADPNLLKLLMIYNQERGEDSTGMVIDNQITKDTEKVLKFLTKNPIIISKEDENFTFIGHARKSSSGAKYMKELAHPFGIYKDGTEKAKYDLVLAMNGTLTNTLAMSEEFDINYTTGTNSDTQVLSKIMANLGEAEYSKALEGYDGTATLLFFTPKYKNTLMVFKDPERPLFYFERAKGEMYISSMEEPLLAIGAKQDQIISFADNCLYRINKGKITKSTLIERKPIKLKARVSSRSSYENFNYGHGGGGCVNTFRNNSSSDNTVNLFKPILNNIVKTGKHIYCQVDRYFRNGHTLEGMHWLTKDGRVKIDEKDVGDFKLYYFVAGYLIKNQDTFDSLRKLSNDSLGNFSLPQFKDIKLSELCKYFEYPCITIADNKQKFLLNEEWGKKVNQKNDTVEYTMPFTDLKYKLKYTERVIQTKTVNIKVCEIDDITTASTTSSNVDDEKDSNFAATIRNVITNNPSITIEDLYKKLIAMYFKNDLSDKMRKFFFKKLFGEFRDVNAMDEEDLARMLALGEENEFKVEQSDFLSNVEFYLTLFENHIVKSNNLNKVFQNNENLNDEIDDDSINDAAINDHSIIETLRLNNAYYLDTTFQKEFYDGEYDNLDGFIKDWVSDYLKNSPEIRQFCEAILICLNVIGKITDSDLISMLSLTEKQLLTEISGEYLRYKEAITAPISDSTDEADIKNTYSDYLATLDENIKEIQVIKDKDRTPLMKQILNYYISNLANKVVVAKTK